MNINKKTSYFFGLFTTICFLTNGQSSLPISGIEVLEQYQSVLSRGDFNSNIVVSSFESLFFYDSYKTVVMNDIGDFENIELVNLNNYIDSMKVFNKEFLIDTIVFSNYKLEKISKKKDYNLIQVSVDKRVLFKYKRVTRSTSTFKVTRNAHLVFTIISYKQSEFQPLQSRILKISDNIDNDNFIIPENFEINAGYVSPDLVSEFVQLNESNGFNVRLGVNYLIAGKNNLSLYLSPGLTFSNLNISQTLPDDYFEIQEKTDLDDYIFSDSIAFKNIEQKTNIKLLSIPIKVSLLWYLNKNWHVGINSGLAYNFPISSKSTTNEGSLTHVGIYNFPNDPNTYQIGDLDSYGFGNYDAENIENTISPRSFLSAPIGFGIGYKPEKMNFAITANVDYNIGLTVITKDEDYLAGLKGEIRPLYVQDINSKINQLTFNLGVKYYFSEPRIPYYRNVYKKEIKSKIQSLKETEGSSIEFNETLQSTTLNLYINKSENLKEFKKLPYYIGGAGAKNSQNGKVKIGPKVNNLKVKIPTDQKAKEECTLVISKPFGYNIFSREDSVYHDMVSPELTINISNPDEVNSRYILDKIPDFHYVYVNTLKVDVDERNKISDKLNSLEREFAGQDFVFQLSLPSPEFYTSKSPNSKFYQSLIDATASVGVTDLLDFNKYLEKNKIRLQRRNVHIHLFFRNHEEVVPEIKKFVRSLYNINDLQINSENVILNIYTNDFVNPPIEIIGIDNIEKYF